MKGVVFLLLAVQMAAAFLPHSSRSTAMHISIAQSLQSAPDPASGHQEKAQEEEVLLRMNLSINTAADPDAAIEAVRAFTRSFPFAAVLPVQPLNYLPTDDGTGVKVTFLRKKTKEKGSQDGGVDFAIDFTSPEDEEGFGPLGRRICLIARRNPEGQTVSKMFSEKIIVQKFVESMSEAEKSETLSTYVSVDSVFHKWMA